MRKKIPYFLFLMLLFSLSLSPVVLAQKWELQTVSLADETLSPNSCSTDSVSDAEVQKLWNALYIDRNGVKFEEFSSGSNQIPEEERQSLDNNTFVLTSADTNEAIKTELPSEKIPIENVSFLLDNYYSGAFAFGLLIDDTLRAGRCEDLDYIQDQNGLCPVLGGGLLLRNSGDGLKNDLVDVVDQVKEMVGQEQKNTLTQDQKDLLEAQLYMNDENKFDAQTVKRVTDLGILKNSVLTQDFDARLQSTCQDCIISTYSMFDKYYNEWFSADLVLNTAGPTLMFGAKKLFSFAGSRGFFPSLTQNKFSEWFDLNFRKPGTFFSKQRRDNLDRLYNNYGFKSAQNDWFGGKEIISDASANKWIEKASEADGVFTKLKTFEEKSKFYQAVNESYNYSRLSKTMSDMAEADLKIAKVVDETDAYAEYAFSMKKLMVDYDDVMHLDLGEYFAQNDRFMMGQYAIKDMASGEIVYPKAQGTRWTKLLKEDFDAVKNPVTGVKEIKFLGKDYQADAAGNLVLYQIKPDAKLIGSVSISDLKLGVGQGKYVNAAARLTSGQYSGATVPISADTISFIEANSGGTIQIFESAWAPTTVMTPSDLGRRIGEYIPSRINKAEQKLGAIRQAVQQKNWVDRRYTSYLDKMMLEEENIIKKYFTSPKGAVKWTVIPFGYWYAKKGIGSEDFSAYMLPDTWRSIELYTGSEKIFNDASVEFFSNEGSDQGDMFVRILNKLPWKLVLDAGAANYAPLANIIDKLTKGELRSKVGDLAVYITGPQECTQCSVVVSSQNFNDFTASFASKPALNAYIVEDTPTKEKKNGQTLIAFGWHVNLSGKSEDTEGGNIDLMQARKDKTTCADALEEAFFGWSFARKFGSASGGVLAFSESIGYVLFGLGGVLGSAVQQLIIAPKLQDCVDDQGGYYVHFLMPPVEEKAKEADATQQAVTGVQDIVKSGAKVIEDTFKGAGGATADAVEAVKNQVEGMIGDATDDTLLQAVIDLKSNNFGSISGTKLFMFWVQGGSEVNPIKYKTDGSVVLNDPKTGATAELDYNKGVLSINGEPIITEPDAIRLSSTNTAIPAFEIPMRWSKFVLPMTDELLMEMNTDSRMIVKSSALLDCLKSGVLEQTGLELNSEDLSEAFGLTETISTNAYPQIVVSSGQIIANGTGSFPRKIAEKDGAIQIFGNRDVNLLNSFDNDSKLFLLQSVQFKNGFMVVNPDTNELIFWLKHHEEGILEQNDVSDLDAELTTVKNPLTGCDEFALNLKAEGNLDSPLIQHKIEQFNKSLEEMGPFQIFETATKTFVLYSVLDPLSGECIDRFKIIDKETGEVYDQAITSITQTPDGNIIIKTADGQTHELKFSADDGRPILEYNGVPEVLTSAQGRNGAFWYDPEKGLWYAENAQLLPLIDAFKQQGIITTANPDGTVSSTANGNVTNVNVGTGTGNFLLDLPSMPENEFALTALIALMVSMILVIYLRKKNYG